MGLVVNNNVAGAGVHALIVGVSDYLNLPDAGDHDPSDETWNLNKLSSPALSAFKIFEFLTTVGLRLPLKTVRLLLSPSPARVAGRAQARQCDANPRQPGCVYYHGGSVAQGRFEQCGGHDVLLLRGPWDAAWLRGFRTHAR